MGTWAQGLRKKGVLQKQVRWAPDPALREWVSLRAWKITTGYKGGRRSRWGADKGTKMMSREEREEWGLEGGVR